MVSVVVPVYNVEPYLNQCIDSILSQTYRDLEVILIDDGSTDRCGEICDSYGDPRIAVFHTDNHGLSAARNLGIEKSHGEYLYFLDSDDWIDPDLMESALERIEDADILCFSKYEGKYTGLEALTALINEKIGSAAWSKLFKRTCFSTIRFPEGRIMEDIATAYKLLFLSENVIFADLRGHHYRQREGSITHTITTKNLLDYWLANKERFDYCKGLLSNEMQAILLKYCACAICRAWARRIENPISDSAEWNEMSVFARTMFPYDVKKYFPLRLRLGIIVAKHNNIVAFWLANKASLLIRNKSKT